MGTEKTGLLGFAAVLAASARWESPPNPARSHRQIAGVSPRTQEKSAKRRKNKLKRKQSSKARRKV